ncbi:MAG: hypothetical protein U5M51_07260 [Emticicia sp.]|nr:hypothetical protein [Emticicia sp.]
MDKINKNQIGFSQNIGQVSAKTKFDWLLIYPPAKAGGNSKLSIAAKVINLYHFNLKYQLQITDYKHFMNH